MKNLIRLSALALCTLFMIPDQAAAQNIYQKRKYRVIAFKLGDNSVFSISNTTELAPSLSLYIPNSFTPNGDGLNDTFGVYGESIKNYRMEVYNRWGEIIFSSTDATSRWDGTYRGKNVPQGAYVYKVSALGVNGNEMARNGTVNIIY